MATYKNYSKGGAVDTSVCGLGLSDGNGHNSYTIVAITVWGMDSWAGCAENNRIAMRQGDGTRRGGHHV